MISHPVNFRLREDLEKPKQDGICYVEVFFQVFVQWKIFDNNLLQFHVVVDIIPVNQKRFRHKLHELLA